jgi:hypothetical protein
MLNRINFIFFKPGCINDRCYIRVYNADDYSYAFINQHYVTYQSYAADSGFIDATAYLQNGLNYFTFLTYNEGSGYNWGFQIMQNGEIVFDDTEGLQGTVYANNDD